ncbi:hypothetical protein KRP22_002130 [Phytophthora ramorum]|nr:Jouberin [Phytophthora ramorum]
MGKKELKLSSPGDGISMRSAKKKSPSLRAKGRPQKSLMRQHRRQSLEAEMSEQPHSPQAESPLLKPEEGNTTASPRDKGEKPSRRTGGLHSTSLQWPKRGSKGDNNARNASAEAHPNEQSPTTTARRSSLMSWRSRNSTASIVEDTPPASCPLSCQPSSCFIGSLNGTTSEMHLPLLTKQTTARLTALKAAPTQRQLEVTIERSDELPFGAYSHPQVRVHIVDRCTGRALCPAQITTEAKFCAASDTNNDCTNAFEWQQALSISLDMPALLDPRTVLLFEILETKPATKGTRFRRGKRFESVSTHDEDDEYRHSPGATSAPEYRRIAWGFFHAITSKGAPTMNSFVLPHVPDANESAKTKTLPIVDVCGLRVRLFEYQVVTWMDGYQARLQWGWRKNHPTMPAVFLQYQKRSRAPAPTTLHVQLKAGDITVWARASSASSICDYKLIKTIRTGQSNITSLQLHPRKAHLLVHTQPNAIFQYELRSYLLLNKSYAGVACESLLVKSTFSPDGKLVISGSEDGVPRLFTSLHGQQLQRSVWGTHFFHGGPVLDVSWSPTAHMAALCSYGGNNPIVVLCAYRDDKDAIFTDESATATLSNAAPKLQQHAVDAFRGANQQDAVSGDHAQRLQRALERRRQRLQAKLSLEAQTSSEPASSAAV